MTQINDCIATVFEKNENLLNRITTLMEATCRGVSPLWFLFITAGLPGDDRRPLAAKPDGDLQLAVLPTDGLSGCPFLRLPGLREAAG